MVDTVKYTHAAQSQRDGAHNGYEHVYGHDPSAADTDARMEFVTGGADGLGSEELNLTYTEYRQYGHRKEDYSQTAYPLRQATPEEQSVRNHLDILNDGGAGGGETGHGLKECIGE